MPPLIQALDRMQSIGNLPCLRPVDHRHLPHSLSLAINRRLIRPRRATIIQPSPDHPCEMSSLSPLASASLNLMCPQTRRLQISIAAARGIACMLPHRRAADWLPAYYDFLTSATQPLRILPKRPLFRFLPRAQSTLRPRGVSIWTGVIHALEANQCCTQRWRTLCTPRIHPGRPLVTST